MSGPILAVMNMERSRSGCDFNSGICSGTCRGFAVSQTNIG